MPKLTEDDILLFLYKTSRLKGSYESLSDSKTAYSQSQHEFRASTNKFPSKAIPRRHLQKNFFSTPCARQRLLKQLSQDHSLTGHSIITSSLSSDHQGYETVTQQCAPMSKIPGI